MKTILLIFITLFIGGCSAARNKVMLKQRGSDYESIEHRLPRETIIIEYKNAHK